MKKGMKKFHICFLFSCYVRHFTEYTKGNEEKRAQKKGA